MAEIWGAEGKDHARAAAKAFGAAYEVKFPKGAAKISVALDQLLAFYDYPAEATGRPSPRPPAAAGTQLRYTSAMRRTAANSDRRDGGTALSRSCSPVRLSNFMASVARRRSSQAASICRSPACRGGMTPATVIP